MREELLQKIREDCFKQKKERENIINLQNKIKELEKNLYVKQYLRLTGKLESLDYDSIINKTDEQIIDSAFRKYMKSSEDTNCIYFCLGTFMRSPECDIVHGSNDIRLNRDDPKAEFRVYIDIEKYDSKQIPIQECEQFEKAHKVLIPVSSLMGEHKYYQVQRDFITAAVNEGQEEACKRILNKKY